MSDQENKEKLKAMLDNEIADKHEEAEIVFHQYLQSKMQSMIKGDQTTEVGEE